MEKRKRISFMARRGGHGPDRKVAFTVPVRKSVSEIWMEIYELSESKIDESKFLNPILKDNPIYRSGVNDGLKAALGKLPHPKISYIGRLPRKRLASGAIK